MNGSGTPPRQPSATANVPAVNEAVRPFEPHSIQFVMSEAAKLSEDASNAVKAVTGTVSGTKVQALLHKISGRK